MTTGPGRRQLGGPSRPGHSPLTGITSCPPQGCRWAGSGWYKSYQAPARRPDPRARGATVPAASLLPDVPGQPPAQQEGGHGWSRWTGPGPGRAASVQAGGGEQSPLLPSARHPAAPPSCMGQASSGRRPGEPAAPPPPADVSQKWGGRRARVWHMRAQGCWGRGPSGAGARVRENVSGLV